MTAWVGIILDALLILVVGTGVVQAMRLIRQLRDLRAGRAEMERFVKQFNGAVTRAEAGIKNLRAAARDSGDDLEKLLDRAAMVRDELTFIVESADSVAERLSVTASGVLHSDRASAAKSAPAEAKKAANKDAAPPEQAERAPQKPAAAAKDPAPQPSSRAEKELMQALQKLK
ncbi:MAG: hypothetical protein KGI97_02010 [Alphaproteobacteria bacterium]|nr:hypothetical protein [Alphaproteobacteria bacterium]